MKDIFKLIFGFLIVFVIILLKPIFNIRIGKYPVERLGTFVVTPEIWIRKKKILNIIKMQFPVEIFNS